MNDWKDGLAALDELDRERNQLQKQWEKASAPFLPELRAVEARIAAASGPLLEQLAALDRRISREQEAVKVLVRAEADGAGGEFHAGDTTAKVTKVAVVRTARLEDACAAHQMLDPLWDLFKDADIDKPLSQLLGEWLEGQEELTEEELEQYTTTRPARTASVSFRYELKE